MQVLNILMFFMLLFMAGCSSVTDSVYPERDRLMGLATKTTVMLTEEDGYANDLLIRDAIVSRMQKNSIYGKEIGIDGLYADFSILPTDLKYGIDSMIVKWKNINNDICLEAKYPVVFNRCLGGRSFCAFVYEMDANTKNVSCKDEDYISALADANQLHNPNLDWDFTVGNYKDEAYSRLSK